VVFAAIVVLLQKLLEPIRHALAAYVVEIGLQYLP
jgi:hypothetical protein